MSDRSINIASIKRPSDIEKKSMAIIEEELNAQSSYDNFVLFMIVMVTF